MAFDGGQLSGISLGLGSAIYGAWNAEKNRDAQKAQNQMDRNFQIQQYGRERNAALEDFAMVNEYNHPTQQMERLRQAGLNPNLVYGKGADNTAAMVRNTTSNLPNQVAPKFDASFAQTALSAYYQNKMVQAQTDNIYEQNALLKKDQLIKDLEIISRSTSNEISGIDLRRQNELYDNVIKRSGLENEKLRADIDFTIDSNERQRLSNTQNIAKTVQEILQSKLSQAKTIQETEQIKVMIDNAKKEGQLRQLDINLREMGINPNDPMYFRILGQFLKNGRIEIPTNLINDNMPKNQKGVDGAPTR